MARQTFADLYDDIAAEWLATKPDLARVVTPRKVVVAHLHSKEHGGSYGYNRPLMEQD